ncbi:YfiR family protein [Thiorhodococcus minor]|uniref:YfiR family protein n=1 Tax=Thiorhodococcus minor TaxID=57489 RepID=A0A6M0K4W1_9GAMM|nr:YfiR family protein [Thiorhodococcus minor]NEV64304.1 YfiR family protein [Thiorhodococcus minor]
MTWLAWPSTASAAAGQGLDHSARGARSRLAALGAAALLFGAALAGARAESFAEVDVRAVFLRNFALFIKWPPPAFDSPSAPLRYCVLGNQALHASLERALSGEQVAGRPLQLTDAKDPAQWRHCHVLYVDHRAAEPSQRVLAVVNEAPVLTVGDTEAWARDGGIVALVRKRGRLRPLINRTAASRARIRISSKLLRLATLVSEAAD